MAESNDQNVLTIFLPLLAVALTICAGACCYMEKRRKQKIKKGATVLQEERDISDVASIISTSSRNRSYLLPSTTTGRSFRSVSRAGSVRSGYGGNSSYGEPPPYSGRASRRTSMASIKAMEEDKSGRRRGAFNEGFSGSQRSLARSRSLLGLNSELDHAPMRRTRSTTNLQRYSFQDNGYSSDRRSRLDDDVMPQRQGRGYSAQPERQRRPSRSQIASMDTSYLYDRPPSAASLPMRGARSSMKRSASQPNLRNKISKTGTYPQGILKRNGAPSEDGSKHGSVIGAPTARGRLPGQLQGGARSMSRLSSYATGQGGYDRYPAENGTGYPNVSRMPNGNFNGSSYKGPTPAPAPASYQQYPGNGKAWNAQYAPSFDPYNLSDSYWEQGSVAGQQTQNPYGYGSTIY